MTRGEQKDHGIIYPIRRKTDPVVGSEAVMAMTPYDLNYLVRSSQAEECLLPDMGLCRLYQTKALGSTPATFAGPCLGAPQAVMAMEKLIALGVERVWALGWCGSLHPGVRVGHLLIPTGAFSEEGTSAHYPVGEGPPKADPEMNRLLEEALEKSGAPVSVGAVWTTDAPYRETPEKVKRFQEAGAMAVEMEMSALMTLARFRGVSVAGLLVVSDELFDLKWRPGFSDPALKAASRLACNTLLRILSPLAPTGI